MEILLAIIIFFDILTYIIIFDVILSWLQLLWLRWRPNFIAQIIDPMYSGIKKVIPTSIGPLDFTPIVIIVLLVFLRWALFIVFPELQVEVATLLTK